MAEDLLTLILIQEMTLEGLMKLLERPEKQPREEERKSLLAIVPLKERQEGREKKLTEKSAMHSRRADARTRSLPRKRPGLKEQLEGPENVRDKLVRRRSVTPEEADTEDTGTD